MARVKQVGAQLAESSPKNISNKKKRRGTFEQEEENEEEAEDDYELPSVQEWRTFKSYKTCQLPDEEATRIHRNDVIYVNAGEVILGPDASSSSSSTPSKKGRKGKGKEKKRQKKESAKGEVWLAKILDIRCKAGDTSRVFLEIQWYYNYDQLKQIRYPHLKMLNLSGQEVVLSDHREIIPIGSCEDLASVFDFDESNSDQVSFDRRDYFTRHHPISFNLETVLQPTSEPSSATKRKKRASISPTFPLPIRLSTPSCTCSEPYDPIPLSLDTRMHYCPRSSCRKWYHAACLQEKQKEEQRVSKGRKSGSSMEKEEDGTDGEVGEEKGHVKEVGTGQEKEWDLDFLLAILPRKNDEAAEEAEGVIKAEAKPSRRSSTSSVSTNTKSNSSEASHYTSAYLSVLPPALLQIASSPVVRGTRSRGIGIVGNVEGVLQARTMVREVVVLGMGLAEDWKERCLLKGGRREEREEGDGAGYSGDEEENGDGDGDETDGATGEKKERWFVERQTIFACPGCKGSI